MTDSKYLLKGPTLKRKGTFAESLILRKNISPNKSVYIIVSFGWHLSH